MLALGLHCSCPPPLISQAVGAVPRLGICVRVAPLRYLDDDLHRGGFAPQHIDMANTIEVVEADNLPTREHGTY